MFNAASTSPKKDLPFLYNWFWNAHLGMPRNLNIVEIRQYAKSVWPQMVFATIKKQLMVSEWAIVKTNDEDETDYSEDIEKVTTLLNYPNRNGDTFWDIWGRFTHDVLEVDAGVVYKGRNVSGELVELFCYDGARFLFDIDEKGIINGYYQYSFRQPGNAPLFFEKDDIVYGKLGINNEVHPYGWAPLQSIMQEIEVMIQSTRHNKEFFKNNAVPDGIMNIKMGKDELDRFKSYWKQEMKGKAHKLAFTNAESIDFKTFAFTNKDMEWLEGQRWYFHCIFGAYGLSPQEVGYYENSNRSTSESQERASVKNAIKPNLKLIADKINREIIPDFLGHDNVQLRWFIKDDVAERIEHEQTMEKLDAGVLTINEVRAREGMEVVEWGDEPMNNSPSMDLFMQGQEEKENKGDKDEKPLKDQAKGSDPTKKLYSQLFKSFMKDGK